MNLTSIRPGVLAQKSSVTQAFKGAEEQQDDSSRSSLVRKAGIPAAVLAAMFGLAGCDNGPDSNTQSIPEGAIAQCNQTDDLNTLKSEFGFPFIDQIYADRQEACNRGHFELYEAAFKIDEGLKAKILEDSGSAIQKIKSALETNGLKNINLFDISKDPQNPGSYKLIVAADPLPEKQESAETRSNTDTISNLASNQADTRPIINNNYNNGENSFLTTLYGISLLNTMNNSRPPQVIYVNPHPPASTPDYVAPTPVYRQGIINKFNNPTNSGTRTVTPPPLPLTTERQVRPTAPSSSTPAVSVPSSKATIPGVSTQFKVDPPKPLNIPAQPTPTRPTMQGPSTSFTIPSSKSSVNIIKSSPTPSSSYRPSPSSSRSSGKR